MAEIDCRRSDRILAIIPIRVTGRDSTGNPFKENSVTISLNKYGACISLAHSLINGELASVKNLRSGIEEKFRVAGSFYPTLGGRREWGLEAVDPESAIWGVEFTPPSGDQPKALLRCGNCQLDSLRVVSANEYETLLQVGMLSEHCERCDKISDWKPSDPLPGLEVEAATERAAPVPEQRRKCPRLRLAMCVRVRNSEGKAETVQTLNVSEAGLGFISRREYKVGEELYFNLPFDETRPRVEKRARIVHLQHFEVERLYGVRYE